MKKRYPEFSFTLSELLDKFDTVDLKTLTEALGWLAVGTEFADSLWIEKNDALEAYKIHLDRGEEEKARLVLWNANTFLLLQFEVLPTYVDRLVKARS